MDRHLTDEEIVAWLDEPGDAGPPQHLTECLACRERAAGTELLLDALRADSPEMPETALASQRERVMVAVRARPRGEGGVPIRRTAIGHRAWWWSLAAAAVAALIVLGVARRDTGREPPVAGTVTLPVVAEADRAAEEAYQAVADTDLPLATPAQAGEIDATVPSYGFESSELAEEFAALSPADQEAILTEMSDMAFDL